MGLVFLFDRKRGFKITHYLREVNVRPWNALYLPYMGYERCMRHPYFNSSLIPDSADISEYWTRFTRAALCLQDRKIIDTLLAEVSLDRKDCDFQSRAYMEAGIALCILGFRDEGVHYLEKSRELQHYRPKDNRMASVMLSLYLVDLQSRGKRLSYALEAHERYSGNGYTELNLIKAYIDNDMLENAEPFLRNPEITFDGYSVLWADYFFQKGDFDSAASCFDRYAMPPSRDYWNEQLDYKKAAAYYKTNQPEKWKRMARQIGYRKAWDKFYRLDNLENEGVVRIPEIDQVIEAAARQKRFIRWDKLSFVMRRLPRVLWVSFWVYRFQLLFIMAGTFFGFALLWKVIMRILHNDGGY
jgi:hypothetical protein